MGNLGDCLDTEMGDVKDSTKSADDTEETQRTSSEATEKGSKRSLINKKPVKTLLS